MIIGLKITRFKIVDLYNGEFEKMNRTNKRSERNGNKNK